jgi:hypothetical protein
LLLLLCIRVHACLHLPCIFTIAGVLLVPLAAAPPVLLLLLPLVAPVADVLQPCAWAQG